MIQHNTMNVLQYCDEIIFKLGSVSFLGILDTHALMEILQWKGVKVRLLDLKHADVRPGNGTKLLSND